MQLGNHLSVEFAVMPLPLHRPTTAGEHELNRSGNCLLLKFASVWACAPKETTGRWAATFQLSLCPHFGFIFAKGNEMARVRPIGQAVVAQSRCVWGWAVLVAMARTIVSGSLRKPFVESIVPESTAHACARNVSANLVVNAGL
eukprot:12978745-Alexandrium_andersonii.AAC.1